MLTVHRADGADALAHGLAEVLAQPLADPFAPEVVAVPAKGVERWLAHRLSHVLGARRADGVCANVRFPSPRRVLDEVVQSTSPGHAEAVERWDPARAVWRLLELVDDACARDEPWCRVLHRHLGSGLDDKGRRLAVLSRLARRFDEYGSARPQMLTAWAAGRDEQGDGTPLDDDLRWQPELWRRLRQLLGPAPAEMVDDAGTRLRATPALTSLPERLSVFGASRLPPTYLSVLAALGEHRDVHLWVHHASPALWQKGRTAPSVHRRADDVSARQVDNLLLASLSRDVRELQQLLSRAAPDHGDQHHRSPAPLPTLLGRLRHSLATDSVPADPAPLEPDDRSVQLHSCHGRTRQVEVLREAVLQLLAADPTLEPRDVLIMCPDVETFAPLIAATFALGGEDDAAHPAARLRVRLADRALTQTNALLAVLEQLLELGTGRISGSAVLDLAGNPAVRARFRFDDDEVERLRGWVATAEIRWGLDADHRRSWQLGAIGQGTWRAGLDRLLLGAALPSTDVGDVVPLDDVDSADIDLAGRLAELVDRLTSAVELMAGRHDVATWMAGLEAAVLSLAAATSDAGDGSWQQLQLRGELAELAATAEGSTTVLGLADVRALLSDVLAGRPTRASFRTGTLTVCTLVPMRSVPHRVVCLLGIDDGGFPRQTVRDGDDVLARDPWVGERDPRSEDRQLLLDAICAAGDHLVITCTGADERTGADVPPAVPLDELLDALDRTATVEGGRVRDAITIRHPLQPFDGRNFTPSTLNTSGAFSFDPVAYAGAAAAAGPRTPPQPFLTSPLPTRPPADVELTDLIRLLEHPARGFLRGRLQVAVTREDPDPEDSLPIELDGLQKWAVGERLLGYRLAGMDHAACIAIELRRGSLPPGKLGQDCLRSVGSSVDALVAASAPEREHEPETYDVDLPLADGTRLTGTVGGVRGEVLLSLTYSTLAAKHRLRAWIELLALSAAHPDRTWRAVTIGKGRDGVQRSELGPVPAADASAVLEELVALYRSGLDAPLPLPAKTAARYAFLRSQGRRVDSARTGAEYEWAPLYFDGEQADAEHLLVHGGKVALSALTGTPPGPGEGGAHWPADETDRFGLLAGRLWGRLLAAERLENR